MIAMVDQDDHGMNNNTHAWLTNQPIGLAGYQVTFEHTNFRFFGLDYDLIKFRGKISRFRLNVYKH
jgi:hypothetical protein